MTRRLELRVESHLVLKDDKDEIKAVYPNVSLGWKEGDIFNLHGDMMEKSASDKERARCGYYKVERVARKIILQSPMTEVTEDRYIETYTCRRLEESEFAGLREAGL